MRIINKLKCLIYNHSWQYGYDSEEGYLVARKCTRCNKFDSFFNDVDKDKVKYK